MNTERLRKSILYSACISILMLAQGLFLFGQVTDPVIIIPGLTGSELINKKTGETVWFKVSKSKTDDLRLPLSLDFTGSHDDLVPGDILREVKIAALPLLPKFDVYSGFIASLVKDGYHEERWELPTEKAADKAIYVYPYDWRLDNVENARLLIRRIEDLKRRLKKPGLKFDVIAHSMGGLIVRYAAMYGDTDLPAGNRSLVPTWAGAKLFDKIILMGTPNEGSALSLKSLLEGMRLGGLKIDLPLVRNMSKFDVFTIPSAFQLLPAPGTLLVSDDKLEPVDVDLYDPKVWTKYGWNPINDRGFASAFSSAERKIADTYFRTVLARAKRLHEALAAGAADSKTAVSLHIIGSDCKDSLDAIVIYHDEHSDRWKTIFKPSGFTGSTGQKVTSDDLKKVMMGPGDGTVTRRSFEARTEASLAKVESILRPASSKFICEEHDRLQTNVEIQNYIMSILKVDAIPPKSGSGGVVSLPKMEF